MNNPQLIRGRKAFTLIEMIIAITVFTIFIGFSISAYLTFYRANQDALANRSLLMSSEAILNELSDATRENKIDYVAYALASGGGSIPMASSFGKALNEQTLRLISPDGQEQIVYSWDADDESLSVKRAENGGAFSEPQRLNSEGLTVSYVNFRIFPETDTYAEGSEVHYQPMVTFDLSFSMLGRMTETLMLDLKTTVTSRFYQ